MVQQALALPAEEGLDADSVWAAIALARKHGRDAAPLIQYARQYASRDADAVLAFIELVKSAPRNVASAEATLTYVLPESRGHAYSAATVLLGEQAPMKWRELAQRLLFAAERPFFR
jgi:hypothetical protein